MAITASARLGLTLWGSGTDPFTRAQRQAAHVALDQFVGRFEVPGLLADRPAAAIRDRFYYATDNGVLYRDTGAAWQAVGAKVAGLTVVQAAAGQAGALQSWRDTGGVEVAAIGVGVSGTTLKVIHQDPASIGVTLKMAAAQAVDALRIQDSAGNSLLRVTNLGKVVHLVAPAFENLVYRPTTAGFGTLNYAEFSAAGGTILIPVYTP